MVIAAIITASGYIVGPLLAKRAYDPSACQDANVREETQAPGTPLVNINTPNSKLNDRERQSENGQEKSNDVDSDSVVNESPKDPLKLAEFSEISMQEYLATLQDDGVAQLRFMEQHLGKRVEWEGFLYSIEVNGPSWNDRCYRVILTPTPEAGSYAYCYFSQNAKTQLLDLKKSRWVRITGVLSRNSTVNRCKVLASCRCDEENHDSTCQCGCNDPPAPTFAPAPYAGNIEAGIRNSKT